MKKGFTLIELLVVIIILSLVALVIFPAVSKTIKSSKDLAYNSQKEIVLKAAKEYCLDNINILPNTSEGEFINFDINTLLKKGYIEEDKLMNPKTGKKLKGIIKVTYASNQYNYEFIENKSIKNSQTIGQFLYNNALDKAIIKASKGIYKGTNPNNYIKFNNELWRIIRINEDDTITIVNQSLNMTANYEEINNLLSTLYKSYPSNLILEYNYCTGSLDNICQSIYKTPISLISAQDYINASNSSECKTNGINCNVGNYLQEGYTITKSDNKIYYVDKGGLNLTEANAHLNIRPVVTIKASAKIKSGTGSMQEPYIIN